MQTQDIADTPEIRHGVYVADGWGIKINVYQRHLVVEDGIGPERRTARFHKATTDLKRLVVLGHTGYMSFEAHRWLNDAGIAYTHLDTDGTVLTTSANRGTNQPKLRRAQALATSNSIAQSITVDLLTRKLRGQARVLHQLNANAGSDFEDSIESLAAATSPSDFLAIEAAAASTYWQSWADVPVQFAQADAKKLPEHWRTFGSRTSSISRASRRAANPANAAANYLYAIVEAEARIAAAVAGLDPGIGVLHVDQPQRDSLALDIMEPVRPDVDAYLLDLFRSHTFRASDFAETRRGVCRIRPPLTHMLAETAHTWAERLGPVVDDVAQHLKQTPDVRLGHIPTPLTEANRTKGRSQQRQKTNTAQPARKAPKPPASHCTDCGHSVPRGRKRCGPCHETFKAEAFTKLGSEALRTLRRSGNDPSKRLETKQKVGAANRAHQLAATEWDPSDQPTDPEYFQQAILPDLQEISLQTMADATGLSRGYCWQIRRGDRVPHPRHWRSLSSL